MLQISI